MNLNEIVWKAASVYPDNTVIEYWDSDKEQPRKNPKAGDTLAQFIAFELAETYDTDQPDGDQLAAAISSMQHAADELQAVADALSEMAVLHLAA
jgi:hypothetical protein